MSEIKTEAKKDSKQSMEGFLPLLEYLQNNMGKLDILLSGDQNLKPLMYPIKGKRSTKTIFMSDNLQKIMAEFCNFKNIKMADLVETCVLSYLVQNGFEDKLKPLMTATVVAIPASEEPKEDKAPTQE